MSDTRKVKREPRPREMFLEHFNAGMLVLRKAEERRQWERAPMDGLVGMFAPWPMVTTKRGSSVEPYSNS